MPCRSCAVERALDGADRLWRLRGREGGGYIVHDLEWASARMGSVPGSILAPISGAIGNCSA